MNSSEFDRISNSSILCPFEDSNLSRNIKVFAIFFVVGFGILSNIFIIVLALKYTTTKNLHHLIINMAIADSLTVLAVFGYGLPPIIDRFIWADIKRISGDIICKLLSFSVSCSVLVSYNTLVIITIERFRASRQTFQVLQPYTVKQRLGIVASSWLIAAALAAHETPYRAIEIWLKGSYACKGYFGMPVALRIFAFTTLFTGFYCIIILSGVILRRISHRQHIEVNLSEVQRKARARRISGAIKMVLISLLVYLLCYLPFFIWSLFKRFAKGSIDSNLLHCYDVYIFHFLMAFLPLVNSCLSPGIFLIYLSDFREAAKKLLCKKCSNTVQP